MRTDLLWRATLPVAALITLAVELPQAVPGGLAMAGLAAAVDRLARSRSLGATDRLLVGAGGVLVGLVLTGMVLGSTAIGLRPATWVVALAAVALVGLGVSAVLGSREPAAAEDDPVVTPAAAVRVLPWVAVAVVVVALSVRTSGESLVESETAPVEMSIGAVDGAEVEIVVSSGADVEPLEVRTFDGTSEVSYPLVDLDAGDTVTMTVALPPTGRFAITLTYPDQTQPLRTLVLDR